MGIRQRAFAQKQASLRIALEVGDGIARRERRRLMREAFAGWHMRTRLGLAASARFRLALSSCQHRCWASWRAFHSHQARTLLLDGATGTLGHDQPTRILVPFHVCYKSNPTLSQLLHFLCYFDQVGYYFIPNCGTST